MSKLITVRDPIHGDVVIQPVQASIIDTHPFQRLRYIRQTGLLHFVFPGSVHTRFAHSIGTMHVAQRVFRVLFPDYNTAFDGKPNGLQYLGIVFECAALLHDIGHCAFSHSIESVEIKGEPLLRPMEELVQAWSQPELTDWWERVKSWGYAPPPRTEHEQLGLLFVRMIFSQLYPKLLSTCSDRSIDPQDLADDILCLMSESSMPHSKRFAEACVAATAKMEGVKKVSEDALVEQMIERLHTLISGTLDVDRLDYLRRDSFHTGTVYGVCDTDVLVGSLGLRVGDLMGVPAVLLTLRSRATRALDDMLWSRYQLFQQVLNHKTNVVLNALLAEALPEAIDSQSVGVGRPRTWVEFLEYTDDYVMSKVISSSLRDGASATSAYQRALILRNFPVHLGAQRVSSNDSERESERATRRRELAKKHLGDPNRAGEVRVWGARSDLIKGGGLPHVLRTDKVTGKHLMVAPAEVGTYQIHEWTSSSKLPSRVDEDHFFVDRGQLSA